MDICLLFNQLSFCLLAQLQGSQDDEAEEMEEDEEMEGEENLADNDEGEQ